VAYDVSRRSLGIGQKVVYGIICNGNLRDGGRRVIKAVVEGLGLELPCRPAGNGGEAGSKICQESRFHG
jgi:hypothetical protein